MPSTVIVGRAPATRATIVRRTDPVTTIVARVATVGPPGPKGDTGATGATGATGVAGTPAYTYSGHGEPGLILGASGGDTYLDVDSGVVYTLT